MSPFERILVPTDMSDFAELALRYALYFNEKLGSRITLMHAETLPLYPEQPFGYYLENAADARLDAAERLRDYAGEKVPAAAQVETTVVDDVPARAIVELADRIEADLIIMGTHGRHGLTRALLGSVTERVLRMTSRPVMSVTPRLFETSRGIGFRSILCPVNFTPVARVALEHANALAETFGARVTVMYVAEESDALLSLDLQHEFALWLDPLVREHAQYKKVIVHGDAAERVLDVADHIGADVIVVGAQHKLFADDTVIGGTTERITRFARQPVLTVVRQPVAEEKPALVAQR
jgi:nucleotide-binding universal stress UspA family protein